MSVEDLKRRIDSLFEKIGEDKFYKEKGLGNEIPFYIFDYDPEDEEYFRDQILFGANKFNDKENGKKVELINLFDLIIEVLDEKNYIEKSFKKEKAKGKEIFLNGIRKTLRTSTDRYLIKDKIVERAGPNKVLFLYGLGTAWPIIRGSELLNNLSHIITKNPLVLFYPGRYDQKNLTLFNKIESEHYYRAFMIEPRSKGELRWL